MDCVGTILDGKDYGLNKSLVILEDKKTLEGLHGKSAPLLFNVKGLDNRLLSVFATSMSPQYIGFILVYDYEHFCSNQEIMEAIIWHEIGHLTRPAPPGNVDVEAEIYCDRLSYEKAGKNGIFEVLNRTMELGKTLNNPLLIEMTEKRIEACRGYK